MADKIRIGVLGHGFIGDIHAHVLDGLDCYELVCVAEPREEQVIYNVHHAKVYQDYKALLDKEAKNLDAVVIALPTTMHLEAAEHAIESGLAVLLEKPMGVNHREAKIIADAAADKGIILMAGMTGRFHPEFASAHRALNEGNIGDIVRMDERIHIGGPNLDQYLKKAQCGHGVGLTNGIHTMDRFLWFAGDEFLSVRIDNLSNEFFKKDVEDYVRGKVIFQKGLTGTFSLRFTPCHEMDYVFEVIGTNGIIRVHGFDNANCYSGITTCQLYSHESELVETSSFRELHKPGIKAELLHFVELYHGRLTENHVDDCLKAQDIIDQFYKQN